MSLTLIVPVLNEAVLLGGFLEKTAGDLEQGGLDWELVLVNDGSTDGSLAIMEDFARDRPRVRVIDLGKNVGPGANLHQAYRTATKVFCAYATVDGFYDTAILPELMANLGEYDGISAYRTDLSAHEPHRRVQTVLNVYLLRALFPRFKFIAYHTLQIHRTDFLQRVALESTTPFLCSEMLFKAVTCGLRIKEVGIPYLPRKAGRATGGSPKLIKRHLQDVLHYWLRWMILRRPIVKDGLRFVPLRGTDDQSVAEAKER